MKKFLVLAVLVLFLPVVVWADSAGPSFQGYDAVVINDWTSFYSFDKFLNKKVEAKGQLQKGTKLEVNAEYEMDGVTYASAFFDDKMIYVKISDLMLANATFDMSKLEKVEEEMKGYVFKEGVYLYKGPSKIYEKASEEEIPIGTELVYEYYDNGEWAPPLWMYTTYNGVSGWVYVYDYANVYYEDASGIANIASGKNNSLVNVKERISLYEKPDSSSKKSEIVMPLYSELKYIYSFAEYNYVVYQDKSGWVKTAVRYGESVDYDVLAKNYRTDGFIVLEKKGIGTYSKLLDDSSRTSTVIPYGTELKYDYSFEDYSDENNYMYCWYLVEYKGDNLWLKIDYSANNSSLAYRHFRSEALTVGDKIDVYKEPFNGTSVQDTITWNREVEVLYDYYSDNQPRLYYVLYGNKKGWIREKNLVFKDDYGDEIKINNNLGVELYESPTNREVSVGKIPFNTKVKRLYAYQDEDGQSWNYVKYRSKTGWYQTDEATKQYEKVDAKYRIQAPLGLLCYTSPNVNSKEVGLLPFGTKLEASYAFENDSSSLGWIYVNFDKGSGWVLKSESVEEISDEEFYKKDEAPKPVETPLPSKEPSKDKTGNKLTPVQIVCLSVGGAAALAITALVSIRLVNKKKKDALKSAEEGQDD